ncbi:MAG: adenylate/guanylate cyclase domain-containing response regulator, partial [Gammaproteobacteria bacterium]|nr:adenylate/guanylate cyclase domain-containing response regulator [Gammaproteobacteria bacterium]
MPSSDDNELIFAAEDSSMEQENSTHKNKSWKILIVDDEPSIHEITQLSLKDFDFTGRPLTFFNAYSKKEAIEILNKESD